MYILFAKLWHFRDFSKCWFWYWWGMVVLEPRPCVYWGVTVICLKPRTSFPGGLVVKNPPWNAGNHQLDPTCWGISHSWGGTKPASHSSWSQHAQSRCSAAAEVTQWEAWVQQPRHMRVCSVMSDSATPWTVAQQAPLSMESGLLFPSPGHLPNPGIEPTSPALAAGFFTTEPPGKPGNEDPVQPKNK